ncbi:MAG: hypothetical protein RL492_239, partial [Verrucomicrobiota bacterium]
MHRSLLLACAAFAVGCKPQAKITSYEVKSDAPAPAAAPAEAPAAPAAPPVPEHKPPQSWRPQAREAFAKA